MKRLRATDVKNTKHQTPDTQKNSKSQIPGMPRGCASHFLQILTSTGLQPGVLRPDPLGSRFSGLSRSVHRATVKTVSACRALNTRKPGSVFSVVDAHVAHASSPASSGDVPSPAGTGRGRPVNSQPGRLRYGKHIRSRVLMRV